MRQVLKKDIVGTSVFLQKGQKFLEVQVPVKLGVVPNYSLRLPVT